MSQLSHKRPLIDSEKPSPVTIQQARAPPDNNPNTRRQTVPQVPPKPAYVVVNQHDPASMIREESPARDVRDRNLILALISTIIGCPLCGIVGVYFALTASDSYDEKKYKDAQQRSRKALICSVVALLIGVLCICTVIGVLIYIGVSVLPAFTKFAMPISIKGPLYVDIVG